MKAVCISLAGVGLSFVMLVENNGVLLMVVAKQIR
jgi:hypothetical protein